MDEYATFYYHIDNRNGDGHWDFAGIDPYLMISDSKKEEIQRRFGEDTEVLQIKLPSPVKKVVDWDEDLAALNKREGHEH